MTQCHESLPRVGVAVAEVARVRDSFLNGNPIGAKELIGHELGHTLGIGHPAITRADTEPETLARPHQ
jgi:hypothetical protein